jgi:hypothetical protein
MRAIGVGAVLFLGACSGPDDDGPIQPPGDDVAPPPDETGTTEETGIEGGSINPTSWGVTARFAFDQANVEHISYAVPGLGLFPIQLEFMLIDSSWPADPVLDDDTRCLVIFEWDASPGIAKWVEPHGGWTGMDLPSDATVRDQCSEFFGLPSDWTGDAASHLKNWTWGVGVGPMNDYVSDVLRAQLSPSEWAGLEPFAVGGVLNSDFLVNSDISEDGYTDLGYAIAYKVDTNFEISLDGVGGKIPIGKDFINQTPGVTDGYYEVLMGPYANAVALTTGGAAD